MPVGVALVDLRRDLRAETGQSLNPAQGVQSQSTQDNHLDRQQREMWQAYDWPHLRYYVDMTLMRGQSIYDYPDNMPFDQINRIYYVGASTDQATQLPVPMGNTWHPLLYGIRAFDVRPGQMTGYPMRWANKVSVDSSGKTNPVGQFQVIPSPPPLNPGDDPIYAIMRFEGQAPCNPLVNDDDTCILDSKAIVLFAAAEILAFNKVEAAQLKLLKAQTFLRRLLANQGADKRTNYNMGGSYGRDYSSGGRAGYAVPGIDYIPS